MIVVKTVTTIIFRSPGNEMEIYFFKIFPSCIDIWQLRRLKEKSLNATGKGGLQRFSVQVRQKKRISAVRSATLVSRHNGGKIQGST